jgi:hypothetical protein
MCGVRFSQRKPLQFHGIAQKENNFVNDVKKITVSGQSCYLMGFVEIDPKQTVTYSLPPMAGTFLPTKSCSGAFPGSICTLLP